MILVTKVTKISFSRHFSHEKEKKVFEGFCLFCRIRKGYCRSFFLYIYINNNKKVNSNKNNVIP